MVKLVGPQRVAERLGSSAFVLVDPRRPMKYLSGHLPGAVNLPAYRAFGDDGRLLDPAVLGAWLGAGGIGDGAAPLLYDSPQGQNAAMVAWILEYLGVPEVYLLDVFFERWKSEGREVVYRPVDATPRRFVPSPNPRIRATLDEVRANASERLVDFRSAEEFNGERDLDGRPGHIPHAVNLVWRELNGTGDRLLASREELERQVAAAGIGRGQKVIAYCRSGPRAALGYLALSQLGYEVRLYDGSFAEWARAGMAVER
ncbi:MAG TPA: rhodanese-like domain-containing protein [Candidatus Binataceae bacterium]|jgi:thiosulfate/3-mercaptopyruvate sulfurtransferase|nr:rhodanese-like domain-containing protein [Candidatus Binataceae bacterium]